MARAVVYAALRPARTAALPPDVRLAIRTANRETINRQLPTTNCELPTLVQFVRAGALAERMNFATSCFSALCADGRMYIMCPAS